MSSSNWPPLFDDPLISKLHEQAGFATGRPPRFGDWPCAGKDLYCAFWLAVIVVEVGAPIYQDLQPYVDPLVASFLSVIAQKFFGGIERRHGSLVALVALPLANRIPPPPAPSGLAGWPLATVAPVRPVPGPPGASPLPPLGGCSARVRRRVVPGARLRARPNLDQSFSSRLFGWLFGKKRPPRQWRNVQPRAWQPPGGGAQLARSPRPWRSDAPGPRRPLRAFRLESASRPQAARAWSWRRRLRRRPP